MFGKKFSKFRRRRIRRAAVGTAAMVLCVFLLFAVFGCAVDQFEIVGNYNETEDEIRGMLGKGPFSNSSIILWLFNRGRTIRGNSFVDSLTVDMEGLHSVKVNVSEKKLIGCVEYDNRYWYFDRAGVVLVESDPILKDESTGSKEKASGQNETSGEASKAVEKSDAEDTSGAKKNFGERLFSKIKRIAKRNTTGVIIAAVCLIFIISLLSSAGIVLEGVSEATGVYLSGLSLCTDLNMTRCE